MCILPITSQQLPACPSGHKDHVSVNFDPTRLSKLVLTARKATYVETSPSRVTKSWHWKRLWTGKRRKRPKKWVKRCVSRWTLSCLQKSKATSSFTRRWWRSGRIRWPFRRVYDAFSTQQSVLCTELVADACIFGWVVSNSCLKVAILVWRH